MRAHTHTSQFGGGGGGGVLGRFPISLGTLESRIRVDYFP